jgi:hypothetical protein
VGRDSSVGIATRYGLYGPGIGKKTNGNLVDNSTFNMLLDANAEKTVSTGLYRLHAQSIVEMLPEDPKSMKCRQISRCVVKYCVKINEER